MNTKSYGVAGIEYNKLLSKNNEVKSGDSESSEAHARETLTTNWEGCNMTQNQNYNSVQYKINKLGDVENEIPRLDITGQPEEEFEVTVEFLKSPSEFYVRFLCRKLNLLPEIKKKLKLISFSTNALNSSNIVTSKKFLSKRIGSFALYYSKCDEVWYRVKVIDWRLECHDAWVYVFLLDHGKSMCVSVDYLQSLPQCFKRYPACAKRCHLFEVHPRNNSKNFDIFEWEAEATKKIQNLIDNSEVLKIQIASSETDHSTLMSLPVILWIGEKGICINKLLNAEFTVPGFTELQIFKENTHFTVERDFIEENKTLENWNPMKEDLASYKNSFELNLNDPAATIYGYIGSDHKTICKVFSKTGKCYKGYSCKKKHIALDPLGFTMDQEKVYRNAFNFLSKPSIKEIIKVNVTCILGVNQFYCIPVKENKGFEEENIFTLTKLMNNYQNVQRMEKLLIPPSIGQIVIAKYSKDNYWYRARIIKSQPENFLYTLVYVDYGNTETLNLSDIRKIEPKYLHLPFQAVHCSIFGIQETPLKNCNDSIIYLSNRMNETLLIEVISTFPGEEVKLLVNVFNEIGEDIAMDLVSKKLAIPKEEIIISDNCKALPG